MLTSRLALPAQSLGLLHAASHLPTVLPPFSLWDYFMLLVLMYSIVVEPFRIAFDASAEGPIYAFESVGSSLGRK